VVPVLRSHQEHLELVSLGTQRQRFPQVGVFYIRPVAEVGYRTELVVLQLVRARVGVTLHVERSWHQNAHAPPDAREGKQVTELVPDLPPPVETRLAYRQGSSRRRVQGGHLMLEHEGVH